MSLLLDALKKAADDKQKAALSEEDKAASATPGDEAEANSTGGNSNDEELTLELDELPEEAQADTTETPAAESATPETFSPSPDRGEAGAPAMADRTGGNSPDEASLTISDEALAMLVNKTNHDVKRDNRVLVTGTILGGLLIVILAGVLYYFDTQEEIASLERKHRIAMQQMQARTSGKAPENTEIIRNLVSDRGLDDKVRYAKQHIEKQKKSKPVTGPAAGKQQKQTAGQPAAHAKRSDKSVLSIEKSRKSDPVDALLQTAWLAYERGDYQAAENGYREVLAREAQNRDALLGMAAIALQAKDFASARHYYRALLELDPRDPDATAGLSSMQNDTASLKEHEDYLLSMLQKNPASAPLNFALANVYAQQKKWQAAQQHYFDAWQADSENPDYIYNLAVSLDQLGKAKQALQFYRLGLQKAGNRTVGFSRETVSRRIRELSGG